MTQYNVPVYSGAIIIDRVTDDQNSPYKAYTVDNTEMSAKGQTPIVAMENLMNYIHTDRENRLNAAIAEHKAFRREIQKSGIIPNFWQKL